MAVIEEKIVAALHESITQAEYAKAQMGGDMNQKSVRRVDKAIKLLNKTLNKDFKAWL